MFGLGFFKLLERVQTLERQVKRLRNGDELQHHHNKIVDGELDGIRKALYDKINAEAVVSCETCGCLLQRQNAIKGKSEIRGSGDKEYIHTPYYCRVCGQEKGGWE